MKIYLAGSIAKGSEEAKTFQDWRDRYMPVLAKYFDVEFLIPGFGEVDETDHLLVLGKDSIRIKQCDLVVVHCEEKIGAGTAMELVIAKYFKKPVVTVLPKGTHHRRVDLLWNGTIIKDWIHPFIGAFSDFVLEKIEDIADIKDKIFSTPIKDITVIDDAVARREQTL